MEIAVGEGCMEFCLDVRGDFACFTRPEMKVERVSYDVITPSAARSIFESVLWKPSFRWEINRIEVINPIRWINIRRSEISNIISYRHITRAMTYRVGLLGQNIEDERQQRSSLILKDVRYRIYASMTLVNNLRYNDSIQKLAAMFSRRAKKGQCINQPYLGCREFPCDFELVSSLVAIEPSISLTRDLGVMLYDMDYQTPSRPTPIFFHGNMINGVVLVPKKCSLAF